jgi:protein phosphatase 2C family protein 2/3
MASEEEIREDLAGTTAICVIMKEDKLFCGNVGDSRAIASVNGNVEILSTDHKPNNDDERKRITAAGGWVEFNRVNGKDLLYCIRNIFLFIK